MEAEARGREPARWCMHWSEVGVFDDNATAFGIDISNLMEAAGQGLAAQAIRMLEESGKRMMTCLSRTGRPTSIRLPFEEELDVVRFA